MGKKITRLYYKGDTYYFDEEYVDPTKAILKAIQDADTTALASIVSNAEQLSILVKSTECTDAFIANNTLLQTYVSQMWSTVTSNSSYFSLVGNTYGDDSWSNGVNNAATANSITFFAGGYYSSSSTAGIMYHRTGAVAKQGNKGGQRPQSVTTNNVEGVSFVGATFGQSGDGYCAYATYKAI